MKSGIIVVLVPALEKVLKIRQSKRTVKKAEEDIYKQCEGIVYKAGDGFYQNTQI